MTAASDTNMPLLIGLVCLAVCLLCTVGLLVIAWVEMRERRDLARHAEAVDAESRRPFPGDPQADFDAWEREHAIYLSRMNHPSNRERGL